MSDDGAGTWVLTYQDGAGVIESVASPDAGATWGTPVTVSPAGLYETSPDVATDGYGTWLLTARSAASSTAAGDLTLYRSSDDGASWSLLGSPASTASDEDIPALDTDRQGNWILTWRSSDDLGGTIGTDADILVARSTDGGAIWSAPTAVNDDASFDATDETGVELETDEQGRWLLGWADVDSLDVRVRSFDACDGFSSPFPGTGEDLVLETLVNTSGCADGPVSRIFAGDGLSFTFVSPGGTFVGSIPLLLMQEFTPGASPVSPFPGIAVDPFLSPGPVVIFDGNVPGSPFPLLMPPGGFTFLATIPAGLTGTSLLFQGFALDGPAANAIFASTEAHVLEGR